MNRQAELAMLTADEIESAASELALSAGQSRADIMAAVLELTGGQRETQAMAEGLGTLAQMLGTTTQSGDLVSDTLAAWGEWSGDPAREQAASEVSRLTSSSRLFLSAGSPAPRPRPQRPANPVYGEDGAEAALTVEDIAARHPELFHPPLSAGGQDGNGHHADCPPDCATDHNQPRLGNRIHPEVRDLIERHKGLAMFGAQSAGDSSGSVSVRPGQMAPGGRRY